MGSLPSFAWPTSWTDERGPRPLVMATSSYPSAEGEVAGCFVQGLARAAAARGHAVTVVAPAGRRAAPAVKLDASNVREVWVGFAGWEGGPFHEEGLPERAAARPLDTLARAAAALGPWWAALEAEARRAGPRAVVVGHWLYPGGALAQLVGWRLGLGATTICHSSAERWAMRLPRPAARALLQACLGRGELVATCWELVEGLERASGLQLRGRALVGPMPLAPLVRRGEPPPGPPWRVCFVGRLAPIKGLDHLLEALSGLGRAQLEVLGDGPSRGAWEELAQKLGVDARFLGVVTGEAKEARMSQAHVLALPSLRLASGRAEGAPTVLLEAMSLGMWVVATDAGGVREVLHSYERAILVEPGDSAALREGLERALSGQGPQPLATPPAMG